MLFPPLEPLPLPLPLGFHVVGSGDDGGDVTIGELVSTLHIALEPFPPLPLVGGGREGREMLILGVGTGEDDAVGSNLLATLLPPLDFLVACDGEGNEMVIVGVGTVEVSSSNSSISSSLPCTVTSIGDLGELVGAETVGTLGTGFFCKNLK